MPGAVHAVPEMPEEAPAETPPAPDETETDSNEQAWKITAISAMG